MDTEGLTVDAEPLVREYRGVGRIYRLKDLSGAYTNGLAVDNEPGTPEINVAKMYARAVISTPAIDRGGDVLISTGCQLTNYERNPVVLWSHGLEPGIPLPLGTSRNPDSGALDVQIKSDSVSAGCWFSQSDPMAVQIFHLVAEGIIRATSVRETPLKARQQFRDGQQIILVELWDLEEWSWCSVGVNPEAVKKCLDRNRIDNRPIAEPIFKSLSAMVPPQAATFQGFRIKAMATKDDTVDDGDDGEDKAKTKADAAETPKDESESSTSSASDNGSTEAGDTSEGDGGGDDELKTIDPKDAPYGMQLIDSTHEGIKGLVQCLNDGVGPRLEHEGVKSDLGDVNDALKSMMCSLQGSRTKHYPGYKSELTSDEVENGEGADSEDMKAFLAMSPKHRGELDGVYHQLKSLAAATNLTDAQRAKLKRLGGQCQRMVGAAKSYKPAPAPKQQQSSSKSTAAADEEQKNRELQKRIDDIKAKIPA